MEKEELSEKDNWYIWFLTIMFLIFASRKEGNDRESLVNKVNESDLSNTEKQKIIDILLG